LGRAGGAASWKGRVELSVDALVPGED